jgi:hypothetical protein
MRWLAGIGGEKCGGGWHDTMHTSPLFFVEQGRQTVLGGAREVLLCSFESLHPRPGGRRRRRGPADMAALAEELPLHYELARLIAGRQPRGLSGWKPANSASGADWNLHSLLGMAGFPVTADHEFNPDAMGYVLGYHVFHDPTWFDGLEAAIGSGKPVVVTPTFAKTARTYVRGFGMSPDAWADSYVVLPEVYGPITWPQLEQMAREELDALRGRALAGTGISFSAPHGVSLHLFDDDVAIVENFRDDEAACSLQLDGWPGHDLVLVVPADQSVEIAEGGEAEIRLPARSLAAFRRGGT